MEKYDITITVSEASSNFTNCQLYFDFMAGSDENPRVEKVFLQPSDWVAGQTQMLSLKTAHKLGRLYKMRIGLVKPDSKVQLLIQEVHV